MFDIDSDANIQTTNKDNKYKGKSKQNKEMKKQKKQLKSKEEFLNVSSHQKIYPKSSVMKRVRISSTAALSKSSKVKKPPHESKSSKVKKPSHETPLSVKKKLGIPVKLKLSRLGCSIEPLQPSCDEAIKVLKQPPYDEAVNASMQPPYGEAINDLRQPPYGEEINGLKQSGALLEDEQTLKGRLLISGRSKNTEQTKSNTKIGRNVGTITITAVIITF